MRSAPLHRDEPSLEDRLAQLDQQLRRFETSLRTQQQSHVRARDLELELASVVERGRRVLADLSNIREEARQAADEAAREALAESVERARQFEQRGARVLEAYGTAIRAAQQAVARAEARIEAFDERVARELAQAGRDIRDAAAIIKEGAPASAHASARQPEAEVSHSGTRWTRILPALLAAALILGGLAAYASIARSLRDASSRAAAAERRAEEIQQQTNQQIVSMSRDRAQQADADVAAAQRAERLFTVLAAPDIQRLPMRGVGAHRGASGQAVWSRSAGVVITSTGLLPLAPNETYQVWLVTREASLSLGTVSADTQGQINAHFDFPAGYSGNPWGFMISREPAGGSARPSRAIVLAS
jgi:hypothetical protein